ncbi:MAG TPA: ABC transporter permease subunit [Propionibacteriaceae bacterium]|nr:ABC transporter permease subunit [Propionibacteriaceae bacterium]
MRRRSWTPGRTVFALAVGVLVVVLVLFPIGRLAIVAWTEGRGILPELAAEPGLGGAVSHTILLAAAVTVAAVPMGTAAALGLARADVPGRRGWRLALLLPIVVPDYVLGFSWTEAYGIGGFTDVLADRPWLGVNSAVGVWAALTVGAVPLTYLVVAAGLSARAEPSLVRAARASGARPAAVLWTITLPLLRSAIAAATVLCFALSLQAFAIPQVMGTPAGFRTVTTEIYRNLSLGSDPQSFVAALVLALLLVLITVLVVGPADAWLGPRMRVRRAAVVEPAVTVRTRSAGGAIVAAVIGGFLLFGVLLPLIALLGTAVTPAVGVPPIPANWTADNFTSVITERTLAAFGRTALLAVTAAVLLTMLGAAVAGLERGHGGRLIATLVTATLVLPGSTLAVALLISYGRWLADTLILILLAYLAKLWAFGHRPLSGALDRLPPAELQAARASGAAAITAVRTVVLRPLAPALLTAWLIVCITAMHEVTMSSLLYGPGTETLAVVVLNSADLGQVQNTAALAVLITLVVLVPALPVWLLVRRLRIRVPEFVDAR